MVRLGCINDAFQVAEIFEDAKVKFENDGTFQWKGMYPNIDNFYNELKNEIVIVYDDNFKILGTATIVLSIDNNYNQIDGKWLNDEVYISIHRIVTRNGYLKKELLVLYLKKQKR